MFHASAGRACLLILGLLLVVTASSGSGTTAETASAPTVKAAFLYNFAKFAEWPADALPQGAPMVLCVTEDVHVAKALEELTLGRDAGGHNLVVRRVEIDGAVRSCHLLYAGGLNEARAAHLVDKLVGAPVFSVSDYTSFAPAGGISHFFVEGGRMRFAINVEAAARGRLLISSRLLSVAAIVKDQANVARR